LGGAKRKTPIGGPVGSADHGLGDHAAGSPIESSRANAVSTHMEISTSIATARRNLAQRIERFLAAKRESVLSAVETTNVAAALACLESARYADGEDAMMLAEKDWPPRGEVGTAVALDVLADRLAVLLRV
jgi:hypothetical protein